MTSSREGFFSTSIPMSSKDQTWSTPQDLFDALNEEFNFVLDAAAFGQSAKCSNYYGPDHEDLSMRDAFSRSWADDVKNFGGGNIWLNPPYGPELRKWMAKANEESKKGLTVVALVPSRTDTKWFHESCIHHELRFCKARLKFGSNGGQAPFPSIVVVMRAAQPFFYPRGVYAIDSRSPKPQQPLF
jgi:site-specific DNA-methyltransferase (adenine-specific)